jgi:predicted aldo/keto reductase-like oxidoreductase
MITLTPTIVLGYLLAVSVAGNGLLTLSYLTQRDNARSAMDQAERNLTVARQCSDGVAALQTAADERAKAAETQRAAALKLAQDAQRRAQQLLARKPTVPGDACASAREQVDDWLSTRGRR